MLLFPEQTTKEDSKQDREGKAIGAESIYINRYTARAPRENRAAAKGSYSVNAADAKSLGDNV